MNDEKDGAMTGMLHRAEDAVGGMVGMASATMAGGSVKMFVENAGISDLYEIEAGRIVLSRSNSPDIRKFAETMIEDHTNSTQQLAKAAGGEPAKVALPTMLDERRQGMIDHLHQANEEDFDKTYLRQQKMAHQEALSLFEGFASAGDRSALASYASGAIPVLRHHNEMLKRLGVA